VISRLTLLGFSAATVPIVLETWAAAYGLPHYTVLIVENMVQPEPEIPYVPPGFRVQRVFIDQWQPREDDVYQFGVAGSRPKAGVFVSFSERFGIRDDQFPALLHPASHVPPSATIGHGALIEPGAVLSSFARVGFGASVKRGCSLGHHSTLGRCSSLNPGVTVCGRVTIGNHTEIGAGTVISDNLSVGNNTIIGAGSVVVKPIPDNVVAYGNPCVVKKERTTQ